jgi:hypothetical protein
VLRRSTTAAKLAAEAEAPIKPEKGSLKGSHRQAARSRYKLEPQVEQVEGGQVKADTRQVVAALDGQQGWYGTPL